MSHLPLWYIVQAPDPVTEELLGDFAKLSVSDASMGINAEHFNHLQRNTSTCFAPAGHWLEKLMSDVSKTANEVNKWNFEVAGNEQIQYAEYGLEQHYDWHIDTFWLSGKDVDRKMTAVYLLSDPSEFTGGEFQLRMYQEYTAPLVKGSIIVFPSFIEHRVTPVLSGVRKTATLWISGPRFK